MPSPARDTVPVSARLAVCLAVLAVCTCFLTLSSPCMTAVFENYSANMMYEGRSV